MSRRTSDRYRSALRRDNAMDSCSCVRGVASVYSVARCIDTMTIYSFQDGPRGVRLVRGRSGARANPTQGQERAKWHERTAETTPNGALGAKKDTHGFEAAWGLRGAGTSQRTRGPKLCGDMV